MKSLVYDSVGELLGLVGSLLGAAVLTAVGAVTEGMAIQNVLAGQTTLGVWEAWMGAVALGIGLYLLGYREFWTRLQRTRASR